jgi:hypothetical protein
LKTFIIVGEVNLLVRQRLNFKIILYKFKMVGKQELLEAIIEELSLQIKSKDDP